MSTQLLNPEIGYIDQAIDPGLDLYDEIARLKDRYGLNYDRESPLIQPYAVIETINEITGGDAIISTGVGQHQMWAAQYFDFKHPRLWLTSGSMGTMGFGLPAAEVQMLTIRGNLLIEGRQIGIDQQVVMAGVRHANALGGDTRVTQTHADPELATSDNRAIRRPDNVNNGILGRRCPLLGNGHRS